MLKGKKGTLREEKEFSNISSDSSGYDESWVQSWKGYNGTSARHSCLEFRLTTGQANTLLLIIMVIKRRLVLCFRMTGLKNKAGLSQV